ncbi:RDD family protein [Cellulomonas endophytica]|uniref:RDD family protein n=1 Tax=Cellulomonas endophytica TaxID=2494735 RepID=UPI001012BBB3|nr:RDD family protein [Cellulomonas endophytica]
MDDGILTGEGVLLDARPASFASRLLAAVLDLLALLALGIGVGVVLASTGFEVRDEATARILSVVLIAGVTVVLPTAVDTLSRGRSLGKLAVGIRIVRDDGGPITFRQALVRALVGLVELWATGGVVGLLTSMVHPQGKRLGDLLAGTYGVRVRGRTRRPQPVAMPPHLQWWAGRADVARLPDGLALAVRQFLARARTLHPASRVALGTELTAQVQRYVRPLPPPGTHPEDFLAAVVAERRERERAARERAARLDAAEATLLHRLPHGVPDPVE